MRFKNPNCVRRWGTHVFILLVLHFKPHVLGTSVDDWYVTYNNRALTNVITTRHVSSRVACCSECTSYTGCISADFDHGSGICAIGTGNPVLYPAEMTSEAESTVFVRGYIAMATCGSEWVARGEFCYMFVSTSVDFTGSEQHCQSNGGHLVYYEDLEDNNFVASTVVGDQAANFWIGREDIQANSNVWTNGQRVTFTNYGPGEPNYVEVGDSFCLENWPSGEWNDSPCSDNKPSVCKKHLYL